jgi:preprotein translocase subunit SecG
MFETLLQPQPLLALPWQHWLFIIPLCVLSVFLTLLILVQRGRGGGLTGALGGMGGQSAFGTKAGDVFTKITIVTAMLWILLSMGALRMLHVGRLSTANTTKVKADDKKGDLKEVDDKGDPLKTAPSGLTPDNAPAPKGPTPPAPAEPSTTPDATSPSATTPAPTPPAPATTPEPAPKNDDEKK